MTRTPPYTHSKTHTSCYPQVAPTRRTLTWQRDRTKGAAAKAVSRRNAKGFRTPDLSTRVSCLWSMVRVYCCIMSKSSVYATALFLLCLCYCFYCSVSTNYSRCATVYIADVCVLYIDARCAPAASGIPAALEFPVNRAMGRARETVSVPRH